MKIILSTNFLIDKHNFQSDANDDELLETVIVVIIM